MNLPNKLTASRFGLTVVFLWAMFSNFQFHNTLALVFFCLAGVTDFLDGRIARARGLITNFGILMDPLADKIMTCSAFIAFVESTHLNPGAPVKVGRLDGGGDRRARTGHYRPAAAGGVEEHRAGGGTMGQAQDHFTNRSLIALLVVDACEEWPAALKKLLPLGFPNLPKSCYGSRWC